MRVVLASESFSRKRAMDLIGVKRVAGSFNFLTGVPVSRLIVLLREQGVEV